MRANDVRTWTMAMMMSALTFEPSGHTYTLDGVVLPSVTAILRQAGLIDFDHVPPSILEAARWRGSTVHQALHYANEHDLDVEGFRCDWPDYAPYLDSWLQLLNTGRLEMVLCEYRVASRPRAYAGTFDWLGLLDGHGALIDYATGDPTDVAKDLQTAGYLLAAYDWVKESPEALELEGRERARFETLRAFVEQHAFIRRFSVRLKKSGACAEPVPYTRTRDFADFTRLLEAQQIAHARRPTSDRWKLQVE